MGTVGKRYSDWLDLTADLVARPTAVFPGPALVAHLQTTFQTIVSWNWRDPDGSIGFDITPAVPDFPQPDAMKFWATNMPHVHPLAYWHATTGDPRPMTIGRVPPQVAPRRSFELVQWFLAGYCLEQQLAIPYQLGRTTYRNFILSRGRDDFSDDDLELARRIQPLLAVTGRQAMILGRSNGETARSAGLTGRELAVLTLLRQGGTAHAIAHTLGMSPRTVHTHLANIYRKLGVNDRMRAVLVADELGLVHPTPPPAATIRTATGWPEPKEVSWLLGTRESEQ